jgi:hypothetical protein
MPELSQRQMPRASRRLGDRTSRFEAAPREGFTQTVGSAMLRQPRRDHGAAKPLVEFPL